MKKLLFLLLPLFTIGQITYKDVMQLNSKDKFIELMFDEQFSPIERESSGINYALLPKKDEGGEYVSTHFATYYEDVDFFSFTFIRTGKTFNSYTGVVSYEGVVANNYDTILRKVKRKCEFVKMYESGSNNYACYDCKKSEFEGYLGFTTVGEQGMITQLRYID